MQVLKQASPEIRLTVSDPIKPKEYFQTRDGLYVFDNFTERVSSKANIVKKDTELVAESLELVRDATDEQIEMSLGNKNTFTETGVCALVALLINQQPKGEDGELVTTGYSNLFYTTDFVVDVRWFGGGWHVDSWARDGSGWGAGVRVFSPQLALDI